MIQTITTIGVSGQHPGIESLRRNTELFIECHLVPWRCSWPSSLSIIHMKPRKHRLHTFVIIFTSLHLSYLPLSSLLHTNLNQENQLFQQIHQITNHLHKLQILQIQKLKLVLSTNNLVTPKSGLKIKKTHTYTHIIFIYIHKKNKGYLNFTKATTQIDPNRILEIQHNPTWKKTKL